MEFDRLTRTLEEYQWALSQMGRCPHLSPLEVSTLIDMAQASVISLEAFDTARQAAMEYRPDVIASIIHKCTLMGFPMHWPNDDQTTEV